MSQHKSVFRALLVSALVSILLALTVPVAAFVPLGDEFVVNTTRLNNQNYSSIATTTGGDFVVVWQQDTSGSGGQIYGQRFTQTGTPIGTEFLVSAAGYRPEVDSGSLGAFVVVWRQTDSVYFQRYDASGVAQGAATVVGSVSGDNQPVIHVAMSNGFVVVWKKAGDQIFARAYDAAGVPKGDEFSVGTGYAPRIGMGSGGNFVVTWTSGANVLAQRYNISAVAQGTTFQVNTTAGASYSSAGIDDFGNMIFAYQAAGVGGDDVYAHRFNSSNNPLEAEFVVNTATAGSQGNARIAPAFSTAFVVVWTDVSAGNGNIFGRRFDAAGAALGDQFAVADNSFSQDYAMPVLLNGFGDIAITYMSVVAAPNGEFDVFARLFGQETSFTTPPPATNDFRVNTYTTSDQTSPSVGIDDAGNFVIAWQSSGQAGSGWDIYAQRYAATGEPQGGEFLVNTTTSSNQQSPVVLMKSNGDFAIIWASTAGIFMHRYNAAGTTLSEGVLPSTGAAQVLSAAADANGNMVIVTTASNSVLAQRFSVAGVAQGPAFVVNMSPNLYTGVTPRVAMDSVGSYVVVWANQITSGDTDIYARRYNAANAAQGDQFRVNTTTAGMQEYPTVAMDSAGNFIVNWQTSVQSSLEQYAQRYDAAGNPLGAEFRVNNETANIQGRGWIAMNPAGSFLVVWEGVIRGLDIYGRQFNADGTPQAIDFMVNADTTGDQVYANAAINNNGNFVVAWVYQLNLGDQDVYARLFNPVILPTTATLSENDFYAAFEAERVAFPAIAQGIADFVVGGINLTVTLNTGEAGRVTFTVSDAAGFVSIQISSITALNGGAASQAYIDTINRDLPSLLTAALDNLVLARFGAGQDVQSITIDNSTMTLTVAEP